MNIIFSTNEKYIENLIITLRSLEDNLVKYNKVNIYILNKEVSSESKDKVKNFLTTDKLSIQWIKVDETRIKHLKTTEWIEKNDNGTKHLVETGLVRETYYRLLIEELFPHLDKVIYLDCDLVICEDLNKLWDISFDNKFLLARQDMGNSKFSWESGVSCYKELNIPPESKYFNAGVLVINLKLWREHNVSQKVIEYIDKYKKIINRWDQDGLNAILWDKWKELDLRWNASYKYERIKKPFIYHFTGSIKANKFDNIRLKYLKSE